MPENNVERNRTTDIGSLKEDKNSTPLITIIIAVLNGQDSLQRSIDSIFDQTYQRKQLIIMDGGSSDNSVEILKRNNDKIAYWESKPDSGIYHAWNKAIRRSDGDYVCFLGSDDYWYDRDILEKLAQIINLENSPELISGKVAIVDDSGKILGFEGEAWNLAKMRKWMVVAHPGMLIKKDLFERFGLFSEDYKIAGDYDFLLRLDNKVTSAFVDEVLVCIGNNGLSRKNIKKVLKETFIAQSKNKNIGYFHACINYAIANLKHLGRQFFNGN